jgi:hypothetical protein
MKVQVELIKVRCRFVGNNFAPGPWFGRWSTKEMVAKNMAYGTSDHTETDGNVIVSEYHQYYRDVEVI